MSLKVGNLRGYVYPRTHDLRSRGRLQGSDVVMGMLLVMLAVLGIAYAITFAAAF